MTAKTDNKVKILDEQLEKIINELINLKINRERKKISSLYKDFMKQLFNKLKDLEISQIDEEEFIKPQGICEGIATGITFKRTQLRKFFAEVRLIQKETKEENISPIKITKLVPKLAYSKARNLIDNEFFLFIKTLLEKVRKTRKKEDYDKFVDIFEAIVAYHYYYNPKED